MELSQTNYPKLWNIFQICIGGTIDKRNLLKRHINGTEKDILEIGCSVGNIAKIFKNSNINYLGIDIDSEVIKYAQNRYKRSFNLKFQLIDLFDIDISKKYDLIVFPAMFHHVNDKVMTDMLNFSKKLMRPNTRIVVNDPIQPPPSAPRLFHLSLEYLEKGEFVRSKEQFHSIISNISGLKVSKYSHTTIGATPFSQPKFFHFVDYVLERT